MDRLSTSDQIMQELHRQDAHLPSRHANSRQRRRSGCRKRNIIEADDRDIMWHTPAVVPNGMQAAEPLLKYGSNEQHSSSLKSALLDVYSCLSQQESRSRGPAGRAC